jgi:SWI/SNF-related matrix-associated actin-dependent regulator 1 of chromatin subfamily A
MFVQATQSRRQNKTYVSYLVRESFRTPQGPRSRTVCNISALPKEVRDLIAQALSGKSCVALEEIELSSAFWNGFTLDTSGATNLEELSARLRATVMIRRTKAEVLPELPPKLRTVIELFPSTEMRALVMRELDAFKKIVGSQGEDPFRTGVQKLKVDYEAIDWENLSVARHETALVKVPLVAGFATEILEGGQSKIVIFAHHRDVIANLQTLLTKYQPVILVGGMCPLAKQASIDRFQRDPSCRVFIGNIQAAGVGITLAPASSHVVFAELSWVPAELSQCEDRLHRVGTIDSVLVQHLVLAGSLDAIMVKVLLRKQGILDKIYG